MSEPCQVRVKILMILRNLLVNKWRGYPSA